MNEMGKAPHVWMVLTKWPRRMCEFFEAHPAPENFWPGTTILNQKWADRNIPWLLRTPGAVRFVSAEPLLGAVELGKRCRICGKYWSRSDLYCSEGDCLTEDCGIDEDLVGLDWLICGGESGPGARPMHPDWARSLRGQCQQARVPFFFKQWGEWLWVHPDRKPWSYSKPESKVCWLDIRGQANPTYSAMMQEPVKLYRLGKKAAGRLLDGRTWSEMPGQEAQL